jgi:hypothetical protein
MYFSLPDTTFLNRFVPKNSFDEFMNPAQKKSFASLIEKIVWLNKISKDTINLDGKEIKEIQIFEVRIRKKEIIKSLLSIIDKAIPYHIVFVVSCEDEFYISTSKKHSYINNENQSIVDWTFSTMWMKKSTFDYNFLLKEDIDFIYSSFCSQIVDNKLNNISDLIEFEKQKSILEKKVFDLESKVKNEKQFKLKVEMNQVLKELKIEYEKLNNKDKI